MRARCGLAILGNVRAGHGQKPREEDGRDHPLMLGPELGLARSGLTSFGTASMKWLGSLSRERLNCGAVKDMLAEFRQGRDDWKAQAEVRWLSGDGSTLSSKGKRHVYARSVAGLQSRNAEIHCARSADPLIAHDFETESLALIQAGHSCAFEGAYTD